MKRHRVVRRVGLYNWRLIRPESVLGTDQFRINTRSSISLDLPTMIAKVVCLVALVTVAVFYTAEAAPKGQGGPGGPGGPGKPQGSPPPTGSPRPHPTGSDGSRPHPTDEPHSPPTGSPRPRPAEGQGRPQNPREISSSDLKTKLLQLLEPSNFISCYFKF
ncbi:hypothetical protein Btru_041873 [Bulinus truncatus]|nr:hypothetical protein Btru_041873 [Bulinus truncatus]